jgi:hypothetical protein
MMSKQRSKTNIGGLQDGVNCLPTKSRADIRPKQFGARRWHSSGSNLRMLAEMEFPHVICLDPNPDVVQICRDKGFSSVQEGSVSDLPFSS